MSEDRKEQLFTILFDVLNELAEHEEPEVIFDRIVDDFAFNAEYHMGKADTFKSMLDVFRHDNPAETIPHDEIPDFPSLEEMYGGISDINREYLLGDRDKFMEFMKNVNFSDPTDK